MLANLPRPSRRRSSALAVAWSALARSARRSSDSAGPAAGCERSPRCGPALVARPGAGDLLEGTRAASVDRCLREPKERALERGGSQELTPTVFALLWLRRVFLVRDALPHLLEDGARDKSAEHAEEQSEGPVGKFRHAPTPYPVQSQPNAPCSVFVCSEGEQPLSKDETKGVTVEGMRDKVEGKVKETEGKLTDDQLREKQGEAQQKVGEGKEQLEDAKDEARERI